MTRMQEARKVVTLRNVYSATVKSLQAAVAVEAAGSIRKALSDAAEAAWVESQAAQAAFYASAK